jgi:pimeloyl-ACP methyl ester carboxylesterase
MSNDLFEFISNNNIKNRIIIGHSMGGKIAMLFSLENPDYIYKLIVIDICLKAYIPIQFQKIVDTISTINLDLVNSRSEIENLLTLTIDDYMLRQLLLKNLYWKSEKTLNWRININAIKNNFSMIFEEIKKDEKLLKPTLFIRGDLSNYILDKDYKLIYKNFPLAEIMTIKNASHWIHTDAPDELLKGLITFIKNK